MGGEGKEGKGRERSALGRIGNCFGPARGENCGASGRVTGAHLRVQLHPVLERFDAELPLAAHRAVSSNTILLRAPRGDLATAPHVVSFFSGRAPGGRKIPRRSGRLMIRRAVSRAISAPFWVRFPSCCGVGSRKRKRPTGWTGEPACRGARQSTRATRPPAPRRSSTTRTPARTSIRRETRSKATDTPPSPRHTRDPAPRLTSESGAPRAHPRSSPGTGR